MQTNKSRACIPNYLFYWSHFLCYYPSVLIIPEAGTRQLRTVSLPQSPLKVFKPAKNKNKETLYTHPATERTTGTFGSWSLFYRLQKSVFPHPRHFILIPLHPCPEGIYFKRTKQNLTGAAEGWRVVEKNEPPEKKPPSEAARGPGWLDNHRITCSDFFR